MLNIFNYQNRKLIIRTHIQQNIYLLKPFWLNVLRQNSENIPTDHFKMKTL